MIFEFVTVAVLLLLLLRPLGAYIAHVLSGEATLLVRAEHLIYRLLGVSPRLEMGWWAYAFAVLFFNFMGVLLLYVLLLAQGALPFNPQNLPGLPADLAFNTAISFVTNTNWQNYGGETVMSYFSQMVGLTVQNFFSAATGMAVAAALFRAFARRQAQTIGNFWVDVTRITLYVLLPLSIAFSLFLAGQGVVQSIGPYTEATTLEGAAQNIARGPAASQVAIKMLGSNGGGFFNVNAAHPFENPTPASNVLQILTILLLPAALIYTFGVMAGDRRQGWALFAAAALLFIPLTSLTVWQESKSPPALSQLGIEQGVGNIEGKELRFGSATSALWGAATTATSNGSVNGMHGSYMPLSNLVQLMFIQCGGVVFGGAGSGMYGMLLFVIIAVFIGSLMVGRTPEYLGKKLGPFEIKMASLAIIIPGSLTLFGTALAVLTEGGMAGPLNPGPRGFSEILYALSSAAGNNGSALAGLSGNTHFYNTLLGIVMFCGRFFTIIPVLAIAGAVAAKNTVPSSIGTLPTHTPLFCGLLVMTVLLVDVLTYIPALALGPVVEHMQIMGLQ